MAPISAEARNSSLSKFSGRFDVERSLKSSFVDAVPAATYLDSPCVGSPLAGTPTRDGQIDRNLQSASAGPC
jgi:hypothetical protein